MKRFAGIAALMAATGIVALGAVACGGSDNNNDNTPTTTARTAAPTTAAQSTRTVAPTQASGTPSASGTSAAGNTLNVTAQGIAYSTDELEGKVGQTATIVLKNMDSVPHTLTVYKDEAFTQPVANASTGNVSGGGTGQFTITFSEVGDLYFRCEVHPTQMKGEISVTS